MIFPLKNISPFLDLLGVKVLFKGFHNLKVKKKNESL